MKPVRGELRRWLLAAIMVAPVVALYAAHYRNSLQMPGWIATGFIQGDMPYYMANAREYLDRPALHLCYDNPFSRDPQSPRIYFQPLTLLLAALPWLTGADPGLLFLVVGLVAGVVCLRVAIALYEELYGLRRPEARWALLCLLWGGGLFAIWEVVSGWCTGLSPIPDFRHDPTHGWWFLNLGRNLVYPTEAFYHVLSLGCILLLVRQRWRAAIVVLFVLSISHPITGVQFCLIVLAWTGLERFGFRNARVPVAAVLGAAFCLVFHLSYYLGFLPRFPEHASVMQQWQMPWVLKANAIWLAYTPVALLVIWRLRRWRRTRRVLALPHWRLMAVWALVSFGLANHEWFITPHQPLHFTRGYIWTPLFLLGAATLIGIFRRMRSLRSRILYCALATLLVAGWLSDNAVWLWLNSCRQVTGVYMREDTFQLLKVLRSLPQPQNDWLLFSNDLNLAYYAQTYTGVRAWYSHIYCTPFAKQRRAEITGFLTTGTLPAGLPRGRTVIAMVGEEDVPLDNYLAKLSSKIGQVGRYSVVFY